MELLKHLDKIYQITGNMIAPPVVGLFLGAFIDDRFGTSPVLTILLMALGIAVGIRSLVNYVKDIK